MSSWDHFKKHTQELQDIRGALGILGWDQRTFMPPNGALLRSSQSSTLSAIYHRLLTNKDYGEGLNELSQDPTLEPLKKRAIEVALQQYNRAVMIPTELVKAISVEQTKGHQQWMAAREENNYALFASNLAVLIDLSKELVSCLDREESTYDTLLDEYDQGMTTSMLKPMFSELKESLSELVGEAAQKPQPPLIDTEFSMDELNRLNLRVINDMGFDLDSGRLDLSEHPFTMGLGPKDVRLTTHNHPTDIMGTLSGTIHECGHGMYEQGLPLDLAPMGLCTAAGCGIHESQSRFWENIIGNSMSFFNYLSPVIKSETGKYLSPQRLYNHANRVEPSLIRIYSDETTYNLHIVIRFELELALFEGRLSPKDAEGAWADAYEKYLRIRPQNAKDGILQDMHWSAAYFGYFPSYTLGNLFSASFKVAVEKDNPNMWTEVENGDFKAILTWLRKNVHEKGFMESQEQIVEKAVGKQNYVRNLISHLRERNEQVRFPE